MRILCRAVRDGLTGLAVVRLLEHLVAVGAGETELGLNVVLDLVPQVRVVGLERVAQGGENRLLARAHELPELGAAVGPVSWDCIDVSVVELHSDLVPDGDGKHSYWRGM